MLVTACPKIPQLFLPKFQSKIFYTEVFNIIYSDLRCFYQKWLFKVLTDLFDFSLQQAAAAQKHSLLNASRNIPHSGSAQEQSFLASLYNFMMNRRTPIGGLPMVGFKKRKLFSSEPLYSYTKSPCDFSLYEVEEVLPSQMK